MSRDFTLLGIRHNRTQKRILSENKTFFCLLLFLVTFSGITEPLLSNSLVKTKKNSINGMDSKGNEQNSSPTILPSELDHSQQLVQQEGKGNPHFGELIDTISADTTLRTLAFSPSGRYLAYGGGSPQIWDMISWNQLWETQFWVESLAFSPDETLLACGGPGIRLRSVATGELVRTLTGSERLSFEHLVFSIDGTEIIASSINGSIYVWDVATGEKISQFKQPGREGPSSYSTARDIALSPDGSRVAFGAPNGSVFLWDMTDNSITKCQSHTDLARCVAFSPDGTLLVSGSYDYNIRVWDLTNMEELISPLSTSGRVITVSFSPDGTILASGHWQGEDVITLWDVRTWDIISLIPSSNCVFVAYSPTGTVLASIADSGTEVDLWNVAKGQSTVSEWKLQESYVNSLALGTDGTLAAASSGQNLIKLWKWNTSSDEYQLTHNLSGHTDTVISTSIAFSPDDQWLISGSGDNIIRFWNVTTGENQYNLTGHESAAVSVIFSPDNHWLASGDGNGIIKLWNVTDKTDMTLYANLTGHFSAVTNLLFSPDSRLLASSDSLFPNILLWNTPAGTFNSTLFGHTDRITSLAFSPDGTRFVSGSWDNIVLIHYLQDDLSSDLELTVSARSTSLAFFSNGSMLVTGSKDGSIQFWDTTDGALLSDWTVHSQEILTLTFTTNNSYLISGGGDSAILFWKVDPLPLDSDLDGMLDSWEQQFSLNPKNYFDSFTDSDSDGLMNVMEFLYPSDPTTNDSDSDTLPDLWEYLYGSDQLLEDLDGDSDKDELPNWFEYEYGLKGLINDTLMDPDRDNLTNLVEFNYGSDPTQVDTDLDGMPDLYEYQNDGLNPRVNDSYDDLDDDTMLNFWEFKYGFNASDPSDADQDADQDGIANKDELRYGTNPRDFWSFPFLSLSVPNIAIILLLFIAGLGGIGFLIFQRNQRMKLTSKLEAPDYNTALRVRHAGLSDYQALLDAEVKLKGVMEEAITVFYRGKFTKAIQRFEEALDTLESLGSTQLTAEAIFYLAQTYKVQGTLTDDSPIFNRFPKSPYDNPIVNALASMLQALLAETKNNWGAAETAWKNALLVEDLGINLQMICQGALAESVFRTWFYDQTYQNQARVISRLNEWQKTAEADSLKGSLCPVYLLRARLALASYRFTEVEQWLERCNLIAEEAGLTFYRDLASREIDSLLQHKERIELLFEADKLLSPEDRGKLLQQYVRKAVLSMESVMDSDVGETT